MRRINYFIVLLLISVSTASAEPFGKVKWTEPCTLSDISGASYKQIEAIDCDYIRVNIDGAVKQFNSEMTLDQQKELLNKWHGEAQAAYKDFVAKREAFLKEVDPKNIPEGLNHAQRLKSLMEMQNKINHSLIEIAKPFLYGEKKDATENDYILGFNGPFRNQWGPYMDPISQRAWEVNNALNAESPAARAEITAKVSSVMKTSQGAVTNWNGIDTKENMNVGAGVALSANIQPRANQFVSLSRHRLVSSPTTAKLPPPPAKPFSPAALSEADLSSRNYFSRGYAAGISRIANDAELGFLHEYGKARTIGDPIGKASVNFSQGDAPICGIAAQYEVMKSHGLPVTMKGLIIEATQKGYYKGDGTDDSRMGNLLKDHGFSENVQVAASVPGAGKAMAVKLNQALNKNGDAIVAVSTTRFWGDSSFSGDHAIYVTGAEVDKSGKVLGYYVNDSGTGEAARFVWAKDFDLAWKDTNYTLLTFNDQSKH